jgi:hypothetical protein
MNCDEMRKKVDEILSKLEKCCPAEDCEVGVFTATGDPTEGLYGSTVTPGTLIGDDCSSTQVLRVEHTQNYQQGQQQGQPAGWAGWSCIDSYAAELYDKVVGGGVVPEGADVFAQGPAKVGAPAIDGNNYPVYPHYTFGVGEEGWVVEGAGANPPTSIFAYCAK